MDDQTLGTTATADGFSRRSFLAGASVFAAALALSSLGPVQAQAADDTKTLVWPEPTGARNNTIDGKSVLKCYAPSTNAVFTEALGLSNPSFFRQEYTTYLEDLCSSPTLGMWGSAANAQPNAYLSNLIYKSKGNTVDETYVAVLGSSLQGGSVQSLEWDDDDGLPLWFKHRPEICAVSDSDAWANASGKTTVQLVTDVINKFQKGDGHYQEGDESYNPSFVNFRGYYDQKLGYMYSAWEVATVAEKMLAADTTKCARYGSPLAQAAAIEKFMVATQYAILRAIDTKAIKRKVVAVVGATTDTKTGITNGVDSTNGRVRIDEFRPASTSYGDETQWDTSGRTNVRYYHAVAALENITDNITTLYPPVEGGDLAGEDVIVKDSNGVLWARPEAIMACDAVIARNTSLAYTANKKDLCKLLIEYDYVDTDKWPGIFTNSPVTGGYGASNVGMYFWWYAYMLFVYPEVINPVFMSRFMFSKLYHIADSYIADALEIVCGNMSLPNGYELSVAGYSEKDIENTLELGLKWYEANKSAVDEKYPNIKMTDWMTDWRAANPASDPTPEPTLKNPTVISGKNTYATMCAEIQAAYSKASTVVVAGSIYGSAVATSLAGFYNAPVIDAKAVTKDTAEVKAMLKKLGAKSYIIVGNKASVPASVESKLKGMGLKAKHKRIAGSNNTALSLAVAKTTSKWGKTAVIASAADLGGLMAASAYARKIKAPLFIVGKSLPANLKKQLKKFKKAVVAGNASLVSAKVFKAIPCKKSRVNGSGAKLAQLLVAKELGTNLAAANSICISTSKTSESIAAASVAVKKGVCLIPVKNAALATPAKAVLAKKPKSLTVVGPSGAATTSLTAAAKAAIN